VDGPAEIRNLNHPNANHNAWFQVNASVQWRSWIASYRRFGVAYQPNLKWSSRTTPLKMWPIGCPETSVTNYQSTVCNTPEDRRPQITVFVASSTFFGKSRDAQKEPGDRNEGFEPVTTRFKRSKTHNTSVTNGSYLIQRHARPL
jgi:hypothetical protein